MNIVAMSSATSEATAEVRVEGDISHDMSSNATYLNWLTTGSVVPGLSAFLASGHVQMSMAVQYMVLQTHLWHHISHI